MWENKRPKPTSFPLNNTEIVISKSVKYLGETIEQQMSYRKHISKITEKADRLAAALNRIMPNTGGPKPAKRKVPRSVVHSITLYAAPIWID